MSKTSRVIKRRRGKDYETSNGFLFFGCLFLAGWMIALFASDERAAFHLLGLLGLGTFILGFALRRDLHKTSVLRYALDSEEITLGYRNGTVVIIPLAEVVRLVWWIPKRIEGIDNLFTIELHTADSRFLCPFDAISLNAKRHLILYLRRNIPVEIQEGWNEFGENGAHRILNKAKLSPAERQRKIDEGIPFVSRRDIDVFWLKVTIVCLCPALFLVWMLNNSGFLVIAAVPSLFLLLFRFSFPRYKVECSQNPNSRSFWWILIGAITIIVVPMVLLIDSLNNPERWPFLVEHRSILALLPLVSITVIPFVALVYLHFTGKSEHERQVAANREKRKTDWQQLERKYHIRDEDLK